MTDIFDQKILCRKCDSEMQKSEISKNGFVFRAVSCSNGKCNEKIIHPADEAEYNKFINLKNKDFRVKMRMVGNSYAVSIPMEIVQFMNEQKRKMDEMVKLSFEDMGRLSLNFNNQNLERNPNTRIIKSREVKIFKNGKLVHAERLCEGENKNINNRAGSGAREFSDSAHPSDFARQTYQTKNERGREHERNKTIIKKQKLKGEIENDR